MGARSPPGEARNPIREPVLEAWGAVPGPTPSPSPRAAGLCPSPRARPVAARHDRHRPPVTNSPPPQRQDARTVGLDSHARNASTRPTTGFSVVWSSGGAAHRDDRVRVDGSRTRAIDKIRSNCPDFSEPLPHKGCPRRQNLTRELIFSTVLFVRTTTAIANAT